MTLFPTVGSKQFKKLHYKEQLQIISLQLTDKEKYTQLTGGVDSELEYIDERMFLMESKDKIGLPSISDDPRPIYFVREHWAAYMAYYKSSWFEEGFSPLDEFDIEHLRMFSLQLFTFPLLSLDLLGSRIFRWLRKQPPKTTNFGRDFFFYLVKLRAAALLIGEEIGQDFPLEEIWNYSLRCLGDSFTPEAVAEKVPEMDLDWELSNNLEFEELGLLQQGVTADYRTYYPLVPSDLYLNEKFKIKYWGFLD